ncbi:MAG: RluA family pseudouridine synthase [Desulfobacteraceae bacterium]|nr:RluA family pseudouridine synthase [Desulfobacteraceae bacterium]MCF8094779.1 RluA family pseudouridine synthase [Desulfobacteraceae bacterium]
METGTKNLNNPCPGEPSESITWSAGPNQNGTRLDKLIASIVSGCSRNTAVRLIREGSVRVNNSVKKPGYRLLPGDTVTVTESGPEQGTEFSPEPIDIDVVFKDAAVIMVNKPPGLVTHPAAGHFSGTLAHGLLYHFPELGSVGPEPDRPGIIHRLDKDTSGLMVIARTQAAFDNLSRQFKARTVKKTYVAFVHGNPEQDKGRIVLPIYRHPVHRKKMATGGRNQKEGRHAETLWRVIKHYENLAILECNIKTGRTHQIRVHLSAIGHPVIGDRVYGYRHPGRLHRSNPQLAKLIARTPRQMLHAGKIAFTHPETGKPLAFTAPLPRDMAEFLKSLREYAECKL